MGKVATLTSKSQITIPAEIRRQLGIGPGDKVILAMEGDRAVLRPVTGSVTDFLEGLGRTVWEAAGSGREAIEGERDAWPRD